MCYPSDLIGFNPCRTALNPFRAQVVKAAMLCEWKHQLLGDAAVQCDIQALLNDSACFYALSEFALKAIQAQLMCDIFTLISTGKNILGQGGEDILGQGGEPLLGQ